MSRRRRDTSRLDPNLTPLLDVVLQLITFFMMLIHFGREIEGSELAVRLPTTPSALPGGSSAIDRLVVGIDASGRLLTDDGKTAREERTTPDWWLAEARRRREGAKLVRGPGEELPTLVVIRADKAVAYGAVRRTMAEAQSAGFARFTLVILREVPR